MWQPDRVMGIESDNCRMRISANNCAVPKTLRQLGTDVWIVRRTKTSATVYQSARPHIPEDLSLHQPLYENLTLMERCMLRVVNTAPAKPGVSGITMKFLTRHPTARLCSAFVASCLSSSLEAVCCFVM
jgi:hypothetical protein